MKGSVTVDGISLTINQVTDRGFSVSIIPHTAKVTTLGLKQVSDQVNLESDLVGNTSNVCCRNGDRFRQAHPRSLTKITSKSAVLLAGC